jgi:hypothetical protein
VVCQYSNWAMVNVLKKKSLNLINVGIHSMPVDLQVRTYLSDVVNLSSGSLDEIVDSVTSRPCMMYPCAT